MEFSTAAHRECYETVRDYLFALDYRFDPIDGGGFILRFSDAPGIIVTTYPLGDESSLVRVSAWLVSKVRRSIDLFEYLLRENDSMIFGSFVLDSDGDIVVRQSLSGDDLDKSELSYAISGVGINAAEYQPDIVKRFGGTASSYGAA